VRRDRRRRGRGGEAGALKVPLVVRLEGTKRRPRQEDPRDSGLPIISAHDMGDAAQKVVAPAKGRNSMSILINKDTKVITQGITGKTGPVPHAHGAATTQREELLRRRS
jgi:hypothetical protein